jgi:hypothetical protein
MAIGGGDHQFIASRRLQLTDVADEFLNGTLEIHRGCLQLAMRRKELPNPLERKSA